ncbi:DUF2180 family protein [Streptomyces sp. NPDC093252]|uniref:DUF2180 family protein n=1 Tax=Streptomyces sp. NPDC093252 TaxID=3154980 RepID=UPI00342E57B5
MTCYDCTLQDRTDTAAIGVCARCGLAACRDHARVLVAQVSQGNGMGPSTGPVAARRFVCTACHTAERAY